MTTFVKKFKPFVSLFVLGALLLVTPCMGLCHISETSPKIADNQGPCSVEQSSQTSHCQSQEQKNGCGAHHCQEGENEFCDHSTEIIIQGNMTQSLTMIAVFDSPIVTEFHPEPETQFKQVKLSAFSPIHQRSYTSNLGAYYIHAPPFLS